MKTMNTTATENKMSKTNTTKKEDTRPAITTTNDKLQANSLDIEAGVFDELAPIMKEEGMKVRRWACNNRLYTFYLGRGQVAEITFRRKDYRVACRPAYAPTSYQPRKSGYGLDAYTDTESLKAAVAEISKLLATYKKAEADKKAEKEKKAAERKAAAAKKAAEKEKKTAATKKAPKKKTATTKKTAAKTESK